MSNNISKIFSPEQSNALKGILAVCVFICHAYARTNIIKGSAGYIFQSMGYLSVTVFLFLSGVGLLKQYKKNDKYISDFFMNRLFPLYLNYIILVGIYYFARQFVFHEAVTATDLLHSFFGGVQS